MYLRPTLFSTLDRCSREGRVQYKKCTRKRKEKKKRKKKKKGEDKQKPKEKIKDKKLNMARTVKI